MGKDVKKETVDGRGNVKFAPGDYDVLEEDATREEKKKGYFTRVTRLALDEVDPS
ncbi:MAG: hypothetical protein ACOY4I_12615 [Bacillota bacterium]